MYFACCYDTSSWLVWNQFKTAFSRFKSDTIVCLLPEMELCCSGAPWVSHIIFVSRLECNSNYTFQKAVRTIITQCRIAKPWTQFLYSFRIPRATRQQCCMDTRGIWTCFKNLYSFRRQSLMYIWDPNFVATVPADVLPPAGARLSMSTVYRRLCSYVWFVYNHTDYGWHCVISSAR